MFSDFLFEQPQLISWSETRASLRQSSHTPGVIIELDLLICIWARSLYMTVGLEPISICGSLKLWPHEAPGLLSQQQLYRQKMQGWELGGKQNRFGRKSNRQCCLKILLVLSKDNLSQCTMAKDWFSNRDALQGEKYFIREFPANSADDLLKSG